MRTSLTAAAISVVALMATGVLGQASADPVAPAGQRNITVNGSAAKTVATNAGEGVRNGAYEAALRAALDQANGRARLVADKLGATLGQVYSVVEQSQQDIFSCGVTALAKPNQSDGGKGTPTAMPRRPKQKHHTPRPRSAHSVAGGDAPVPPQDCQQYANVSVTYQIS